MNCGSHIKIRNLSNHMKKQNKKHQNVWFIDEKLKTKSMMFFVSLFLVICKAFGASFLYWVDFTHFIQSSVWWSNMPSKFYQTAQTLLCNLILCLTTQQYNLVHNGAKTCMKYYILGFMFPDHYTTFYVQISI